jgi:hypothetical protein
LLQHPRTRALFGEEQLVGTSERRIFGPRQQKEPLR